MSSALWPVAMRSAPTRCAPRSRACRRNTPQKVPGAWVAVRRQKGCRPGNQARTVVLQADLSHNLVHGPAIQVPVRHDHERDLVLVLVALHSLHATGQQARAAPAGSAHLKRVVTVAGDPLIHGEEEEVQAVVVPQVQQCEYVCQHGRVCPRRGVRSSVCGSVPSRAPLPPEAATATRSPRRNISDARMVSCTSRSKTEKKHSRQSLAPVLGRRITARWASQHSQARGIALQLKCEPSSRPFGSQS